MEFKVGRRSYRYRVFTINTFVTLYRTRLIIKLPIFMVYRECEIHISYAFDGNDQVSRYKWYVKTPGLYDSYFSPGDDDDDSKKLTKKPRK